MLNGMEFARLQTRRRKESPKHICSSSGDVETISLAQVPPFRLNCPDPVEDLCVNAPRPDRRFKPRSEYPTELATLGDHIRKRRLDLGLSQASVVKMFGVNRSALCNWERGAQAPSVEYMPMIIDFLGYNPLPKDGSVAEQIRSARRSIGLTQLDLGRRLGVSRETVNYWENGKRRPEGSYLERIIKALDGKC